MTTTRPTHGFDVFAQADQTASHWLDAVARRLDTDDRHYAYRVVRAWLHTVRDRLTIDVAVHFGAQLPLLWRGVFYDGWTPSRVPVKYDAEQLLTSVAQDVGGPVSRARDAVAAVTAGLAELTSPDQVDHVLATLPDDIRGILAPAGGRHHLASPDRPAAPVTAPAPRTAPDASTGVGASLDTRVANLERELQVAIDALSELVQALEERPTNEPEPDRLSVGARRAHQILLTRPTAG
jgi:uncharacterized protein (DUF2267 family)